MKKSAVAKTTTLLLCLGASLLPTLAQAEDSPISYNVGVVSDYRYRGISQTALKPALQGGVDYAKGAFYAGTWLSTISWIKDAGKPSGIDSGNAPLEWDLYLGTKGELAKDLSYDVGALAYVYVGEKFHDIGLANPDTGEIYGALTYGLFTAKYSHSLTNLFGVGSSKNSGYLDVSAAFDLGSGFSLTPHVGYQNVAKNSVASYTDYALTLGKDFGKGLSGTAAVLGTDASKSFYVTPSGKFTGKTMAVVGVKYAF